MICRELVLLSLQSDSAINITIRTLQDGHASTELLSKAEERADENGMARAGIALLKFKTLASSTEKVLNTFTKDLPIPFTFKPDKMKLGAFSVSLNVRDIKASKAFYENIGFEVFAGDIQKNYLIMKNSNTLIGLFQGMFEKTILTFNPGWDENASKVEKFDDVRVIQKQLKSKGIKMLTEADEETSGPASCMLLDPDGNQILFDQHI